jgi:hypothetical protein
MLRAISVDQELEGQASHATGTSRLQRQAILLVDVLVAF